METGDYFPDPDRDMVVSFTPFVAQLESHTRT